MDYNDIGICVQIALTSASQAENTGSNPVGAILLRLDAFARGFGGIPSKLKHESI